MGAAVATAAGAGVSRRPWLVRAGFGRPTAHRRAARGPLTRRCHFLVSGGTRVARSSDEHLPGPSRSSCGRSAPARRTEAFSSARRTSRGSLSTSTATGASASASRRHLEKTRSSSPLTPSGSGWPRYVARHGWVMYYLDQARTPGGRGRGCRARTGELHHPGSDAAWASLGRLRTGDRGDGAGCGGSVPLPSASRAGSASRFDRLRRNESHPWPRRRPTYQSWQPGHGSSRCKDVVHP
jgi:hypothetical protein